MGLNRCIHTMDCYSAIEGNEVLIGVTTWMNLGNMLSEQKGDTKATCYMIPFI